MQRIFGLPLREQDEERIADMGLTDDKIRFMLVYDRRSLESVAYGQTLIKFLTELAIRFHTLEYEGQKAKDLLDDWPKDKANTFVFLKRLPSSFLEEALSLISPDSDPDCMTRANQGGMLIGGKDVLFPATAQAVMRLLDHYKIDVKGQKCLVVGRSNNVGLPLSLGLLKRDAMVTTVHSKVPLSKIEKEVSQSDIIFLCSGIKGLIEKKFFKKDQIVIDCGYHGEDGSGDLGFVPEEGSLKAYTPVPGGVGPLTVSTLVLNALIQKGLLKNERPHKIGRFK